MNIFKTLASGSGSINEPNVSAFLGYLLNPKEDHGLGDTFLKKFLEPLLSEKDNLKHMKNRNLSIHSNFEIEVLLEQAFKNDDKKTKKEIVDIVILCYEKESQQGQFLAENIIKQKKEGVGHPTHIFLIENKIKDDSVTPEQLKQQFVQTTDKLESWNIDTPENLVSVIFVTPKGNKADNVFKKLDIKNKCHLYWHKKDKDTTSTNNNTPISEIIKDIIKEESHPIDVYCKHTLQAFLEFIESDFKSTITEELEEKKREIPEFEYNGKRSYTRPRLAEKLISDYVEKFEKDENRKITFDELSKKFGAKMRKKSPPFVKEEYATKDDYRKKDNTLISEYYGYYNNPIQLADAKICSCTGYNDKELQELYEILEISPNDIKRIK